MNTYTVGEWSVTCRDDGNVIIASGTVSNTYHAQTILSGNAPIIVGTAIGTYSEVIVNRDDLSGIRAVVVREYFTD